MDQTIGNASRPINSRSKEWRKTRMKNRNSMGVDAPSFSWKGKGKAQPAVKISNSGQLPTNTELVGDDWRLCRAPNPNQLVLLVEILDGEIGWLMRCATSDGVLHPKIWVALSVSLRRHAPLLIEREIIILPRASKQDTISGEGGIENWSIL